MAFSLLCVKETVIMADNDHIWIEIENEEQVMAGITATTLRARHQSKELLEHLANDARILLTSNVPVYTSYTQRHIDSTDVDWKPGGAGGGGEYEATVGIKAGTSYHPVYVNQGTGEFGPYIKAPYTAVNGGLLWFYSKVYGRVIGVESVRGQRAQHFLYTSFKELQVFALARLHMKHF
jgi:hypothetical protein